MIEGNTELVECLKKIKKDQLQSIIDDYNLLAQIYEYEKIENKKSTKDELISLLLSNIKEYVEGIIRSLDLADFEGLKILLKSNDVEELNNHKVLINYLLTKSILWQEDNLIIPKDIYGLLKEDIKRKDVINDVKKNERIYRLVDGIIIAYGVIDIKTFKEIICAVDDFNLVELKLKFYYKKNYKWEDKGLVSEKLTNKKRINRYFKDKNYHEFSNKEFIDLGLSVYHHNIKAYKKFIKMLRTNYVFKKKDIEFVDKNIVIPYLYNSINEENLARKNLEETVVSLFEFKGDKLKQKMLEEIMLIRNEFPLWEYRGYTRKEENHE